MRYVRWQKRLETGDREVDEQHRALHSLVNDLNACTLFGDNRTAAVTALERILRHTTTHFMSEEALMIRSAYPRTPEHVGIHRTFSDTLAELATAQRAGHGPTVTELAAFMESWLIDHIRDHDQALVEHLQKPSPS